MRHPRLRARGSGHGFAVEGTFRDKRSLVRAIKFLAGIINQRCLCAPILPIAARWGGLPRKKFKMVATTEFNPDEGAAEAFSKHLAVLEIAVLKLQDNIDSVIAQVTPGAVRWSDVARLTVLVQALRQAGFVTETA
jgi:hypothetical protein